MKIILTLTIPNEILEDALKKEGMSVSSLIETYEQLGQQLREEAPDGTSVEIKLLDISKPTKLEGMK